MSSVTERLIDRLSNWQNNTGNDGVYSRSLQLLLNMLHLAVSISVGILKKASSSAASERNYDTPDAFIYAEEPEWRDFTFFPDIEESPEGWEKVPFLVFVSSFIKRLQHYSNERIAGAIRHRLFILVKNVIPWQKDGLLDVLAWWLRGCTPGSIDESVLASHYPIVSQIDRNCPRLRHKKLSEQHCGMQFVTDYIFSCLRVNSNMWTRSRRRSAPVFYSIDNGTWAILFDSIFRGAPREEDGFEMDPGTYADISSDEEKGNTLEALLSFAIYQCYDFVTAALCFVLIVRISMGPDYPTGIAEYFDEAVRGHAPLRTLQDPASSSSFQSDRLSWREYLGQVKHLSDIEALREHDSGWLRLMNRAFTSQLNSITASTFPSFSAGKRHRRARPSGKRYAGKRRPKRKANQNDAAPDVD